MCQYLSFQTVNSSFYVVLSIILGNKNNKNSNKFILCYHFSCENPTCNNKFIVLYCFCLKKLPQHKIPKPIIIWMKQYFFVIMLCSLVLVVKKVLPQTFANYAVFCANANPGIGKLPVLSLVLPSIHFSFDAR